MRILLSAIILLSVFAKIEFYSPENLIDLYKDNPLKHNILNMGDIPYGRSIIGKVIKA